MVMRLFHPIPISGGEYRIILREQRNDDVQIWVISLERTRHCISRSWGMLRCLPAQSLAWVGISSDVRQLYGATTYQIMALLLSLVGPEPY